MPLAQLGTRTKQRSWLYILALVALGCGARSTEAGLGSGGTGPSSGGSGSADAGDDPVAGAMSTSSGGTGGSGGASGLGGMGGAGGVAGVAGTGGAAASEPDPYLEELICKATWAPDFGGSVTSEDDDFDPTTLDTFSGIVESIDLGATGFEGIGRGMDPDQLYAFTVRDGERSRVVTLQILWRTPLVEVGDAIEVAYSYQRGQWTPSTGRLTLRDADGDVLLWIEQQIEGPGALTPPPGFSVANGTKSCTFEDSCGDSTRISLSVRGDGAEADIGFGETADVGGYVFLHGNNTDFAFTGGCTDTSSLHTVRIAAVRGTNEGLSARDRGRCAAAACADGQYCVVPGVDACDGTNPEATCASAPPACDTACSLVCGCDGKLYCSVCHAQQAGIAVNEDDISCMVGTCNGEDGISSAGPCTMYWGCYGREYGFSCDDIGDVQRCRCMINSSTVASVDTADPQCEDVPSLCGFPPLPF